MRKLNLIKIKDAAPRPCERSAMSRLIGLLFALLLSLASGLAGGPRVHAMGSDGNLTAMVICSESGARTIYLDAEGSPATPASDCEDCPLCIALSAPVLMVPQHAIPVRTARRRARSRPATALVRTRARRCPQSRGPPSTIPSSAIPTRVGPDDLHASTAAQESTETDFVASGMRQSSGRCFKDAR